jgi:hypothetical protein
MSAEVSRRATPPAEKACRVPPGRLRLPRRYANFEDGRPGAALRACGAPHSPTRRRTTSFDVVHLNRREAAHPFPRRRGIWWPVACLPYHRRNAGRGQKPTCTLGANWLGLELDKRIVASWDCDDIGRAYSCLYVDRMDSAFFEVGSGATGGDPLRRFQMVQYQDLKHRRPGP